MLVKTSNHNMESVVGQNVLTSRVSGDELLFEAQDGTQWVSAVKRIYTFGRSVVFETAHSSYSFQLYPAEKLVMGVTV